jgi:geranylgeranyl pyrophosphate synthase
MAKYLIFSKDTNQLTNIADSEESKNNFILNQVIYTVAEATESQYEDIKLGKKTAKLNNGVLSVFDFSECYEAISSTDSLEAIKKRIEGYIKLEINNLHAKLIYDSEYENALKAININSLNSIPNQTIPNWVLSQISIPFKRPFEV